MSKNEFVSFEVYAKELPKMDVIGTCDAYFKLYREDSPDEPLSEIFRSETIMNTLNPTWKDPVLIPYSYVFSNSKYNRIKVCLWDWDR